MPIKILNGIDVDNGVLYTDTSNNRVGINTSSPQVPLEVKHGGAFIDEIIRIVGETSGKPQLTFYNGTALHTKIVAAGNDDFSISNLRPAGDMFFSTGGATRLKIEASGNVGIGTTSPSTKLEVVDTFSVQRTSTDNEGFYVTVNGADANAIVETFYQEDSSSYYGIRKRYDGSTNLYQEFIHDNSPTGTEIYRVDRGTKNTSIANGNVGIGTTSPNSRLEVNGEIDANGGDGYRIDGKPWANWASNLLTLGDWDGEGYATSIVGNNSDNEVRITDTGVGIGISAPATKLHIGSSSSSSSTTEEFRLQTSSSGGYGGNAVLNFVTGQYGTSGIYFGDQATYTSQPAFVRFVDVSNYMQYDSIGSHIFTYSGNEIFRTNGYNVGIGTTIPSEKLEVDGTVKATEYKGYLPAFQHGGFYHSSSGSSSTIYWIPTNYIAETTSSQYYNNWVAPYSGRVKKIVMRWASGTTPTATSVTFRKSINGGGDLSTYPATIANAASTTMTATRVFGSTDIAFNEGDRVRIGFTTDGGTRLLYGFAYTIVLEYNKD